MPEQKALLVENPIVGTPFDEPMRHWAHQEGQPVLVEARREAGYYLRPRTRGAQKALWEEEFVPLEIVNRLREKVGVWRQVGYPGVTPTTRRLLKHWSRPDREKKLFFCQREAAETLIWLVEAPPAERQGIIIPTDQSNTVESQANGYGALARYAVKMATGSGKTVVMGMVIAWQVLNKLANPQDRRFTDAVLLVCPNLTIRNRLQVLKPENPSNYYLRFDLLPSGADLERLAQGRYQITNWHLFQLQDDSRTRSVMQRGVESDRAFCRRVLRDLGAKERILVINDEAHHAYRPAQPLTPDELKQLPREERAVVEEDFRAATVWVEGLDRIHAVRGIHFCADFSATPFYIKGSGYEEGSPLPWIVSDFGLVDAIESGIVKIPRVPVDDNTGALIPRYFHLWQYINQALPASERQTARRRAKPESVLREAEGALAMLASEWKDTLQKFTEGDSPVPPALIVVCDNTGLAEVVHEHIASGSVLQELANQPGREVTLRIDSKLLDEAENAVEGESKQDAAERLRQTVDTLGKTEWDGEGDPPGRDVRCVVSVSMLTEGWDAQNVTQILGLRAFSSQLLCEQVVGRGLRRMNYDDFSQPEYVDVYGVPFEVIPVKKKAVGHAEPIKVSTLIRSLPERKQLEITFPRVEGYIFDVRQRIRADIEAMPYLQVDPTKEPTQVDVKPMVGYRLARPDRLGPGEVVTQDRNPFHQEKRLQATVYEIAAELTHRLKDKDDQFEARHLLFPQVLDIVWRYLNERVVFTGDAPMEDVALLKYRESIVERLTEAIEPDTQAGEPPLLPIIERFRPTGSTSEVLFRTVRYAVGTTRSHISHVVLDSPVWEHGVAYRLETLPQVVSYARNDHLDLVIPYEWQGIRHEYRPDYIVRWRTDEQEVSVILEVKGLETEQDRQKAAAAERWVRAVNYHGEFGRWAFGVCKDPNEVREVIEGTLRAGT